MFLSFRNRNTPFSTTFSQLIKVQVKNCKLIMLRYITCVSVLFPFFQSSTSVVFEMFASICQQLQTCDPSSPDGIHPLVRVLWMRIMKIWLYSTYWVLKCLCFVKFECTGWILLLSMLWAQGSNYLHLCGNAFSNIIQPEPEPSIQKLLNQKYKTHAIYHKPVETEEIWT